MTKRDIVVRISEETDLQQQKVLEIVQKTLDYIAEALARGKKVELRNFGVFEVKKRAARRARNPKTGDKVQVPERFVVTFKPGKEMEHRVKLLEEESRFQESGFMPHVKEELDAAQDRETDGSADL